MNPGNPQQQQVQWEEEKRLGGGGGGGTRRKRIGIEAAGGSRAEGRAWRKAVAPKVLLRCVELDADGRCKLPVSDAEKGRGEAGTTGWR